MGDFIPSTPYHSAHSCNTTVSTAKVAATGPASPPSTTTYVATPPPPISTYQVGNKTALAVSNCLKGGADRIDKGLQKGLGVLGGAIGFLLSIGIDSFFVVFGKDPPVATAVGKLLSGAGAIAGCAVKFVAGAIGSTIDKFAGNTPEPDKPGADGFVKFVFQKPLCADFSFQKEFIEEPSLATTANSSLSTGANTGTINPSSVAQKTSVPTHGGGDSSNDSSALNNSTDPTSSIRRSSSFSSPLFGSPAPTTIVDPLNKEKKEDDDDDDKV